MKQKIKSKAKSIVNLLLLSVLMAGTIVPSVFFDVKTAEANAYCTGSALDIYIYDQTDGGTLIGTYSADGTAGGIGATQHYEITLPYGHQIRYVMDPGGTPSFTIGRFYRSGSYTHSQHTYSPNPTPGMGLSFTAPAIVESAIFTGGVHQNVCTPNPDPSQSGDPFANVLLTISVVGGPSGPTYINRSGSTNLAIYGDPVVSLLGSTASVPPANTVPILVGESVDLSWTTEFVNSGNSCTATNDRRIAKNLFDSAWNGVKNGSGGGSQSVGPFDAAGTFNYSITCTGFNGRVSNASTVTIIVGSTAYYTCSVSPASQSVPRGSSGAVDLDVTEYNGYSNPVTFNAPTITPTTPTVSEPPTVSYESGSSQSSPYTTPVTATITTSATTSVENYTMVFTTTDGKTCDPANGIVFSVTQQDPYGEIWCDTDNPGPCNADYGQSTEIAWESLNVDSCQIYRTETGEVVGDNEPVLWSNGPVTGMRDSDPIVADTIFDLSCTGPNGDVQDQVLVNVNAVSINLSVTLANDTSTPCETLKLYWTPGASNPAGTTYKLYRATNPAGPWINEIYSVTNGTNSYTDTPPQPSGNYYKVKASYASVVAWSNVVGPLGVTLCQPSVDGSDKDIYGANTDINSITSGTLTNICNSSSSEVYNPAPNNIWKAGSRIYFPICVKNSGTEVLTGVQIVEMQNKIEELSSIRFEKAINNCATSNGAAYPTMTLVSDLQVGSVCTVIVSGVINTPTGPASNLYRFRNWAEIRTAQMAAYPVYTDRMPFGIGSSIPDRTETAP